MTKSFGSFRTLQWTWRRRRRSGWLLEGMWIVKDTWEKGKIFLFCSSSRNEVSHSNRKKKTDDLWRRFTSESENTWNPHHSRLNKSKRLETYKCSRRSSVWSKESMVFTYAIAGRVQRFWEKTEIQKSQMRKSSHLWKQAQQQRRWFTGSLFDVQLLKFYIFSEEERKKPKIRTASKSSTSIFNDELLATTRHSVNLCWEQKFWLFFKINIFLIIENVRTHVSVPSLQKLKLSVKNINMRICSWVTLLNK